MIAFESYQARYAHSFWPIELKEGAQRLRKVLLYTCAKVDRAFQWPQFLVKICQVVMLMFSSLFPFSDLEETRQFFKDAKNLTNTINGLKSIRGILSGRFSLKCIILNGSGLTLFILNILILTERLGLANLSKMKMGLHAIPRLGILPMGGILSLSMIGLMSMLMWMTLEKKRQTELKERDIKQRKIAFWSGPLDLNKVHERSAKYTNKLKILTQEVVLYEKLIQEGNQKEKELKTQRGQHSQMKACRKALQELNMLLKNKQTPLYQQKQKTTQWELLEKNWKEIDREKLENFRQLKEKKWKAKLEQVHYTQQILLFSMISITITLAKQILTVGAALLGFGLLVLPLYLSLGLDCIKTGLSCAKFFWRNHYIKEIKMPIQVPSA